MLNILSYKISQLQCIYLYIQVRPLKIDFSLKIPYVSSYYRFMTAPNFVLMWSLMPFQLVTEKCHHLCISSKQCLISDLSLFYFISLGTGHICSIWLGGNSKHPSNIVVLKLCGQPSYHFDHVDLYLYI